ncbi:ubiquitin-associated domain-containing protein 2 [Hippocampus zosterae]|uniref:ubiquitin-associated domain-containing protein 2 n=1 Tax=Hippocampus zosterae TaxID=109293 RepID=UPI00223D6CC9|nr:ubiquitin-associated domain-containing protein 2 [Hippocampus zosterae]
MFTTTGSHGLYKAPLSKGLLLVLSGLTVMLSLLPQYQHMFEYNLHAVSHQLQVWRLLCGRLVCLDVKDSFCSGMLIYNFRIFERRFGSRKFASFLLATWCVSALLDLLLAQSVSFLFDNKVEELPAGLLAPVFALFVPFYWSIPRVPVTKVLGLISITNKTLVYIVGLQLLTSGPYMWLLALSGLVSGALYHSNVLWLQNFLFVPARLCAVARYFLEPLFSSSQPIGEAPLGMGATLDIQRQQRMDRLDQQLLLAQLDEARANSRHRAQWSSLFPSLRRRRPAPPPPQPPTQPSAPPPPSDNNSIAEEQVARLVEMGFSRPDALEALRVSNNDINMATNFLLQH